MANVRHVHMEKVQTILDHIANLYKYTFHQPQHVILRPRSQHLQVSATLVHRLHIHKKIHVNSLTLHHQWYKL